LIKFLWRLREFLYDSVWGCSHLWRRNCYSDIYNEECKGIIFSSVSFRLFMFLFLFFWASSIWSCNLFLILRKSFLFIAEFECKRVFEGYRWGICWLLVLQESGEFTTALSLFLKMDPLVLNHLILSFSVMLFTIESQKGVSVLFLVNIMCYFSLVFLRYMILCVLCNLRFCAKCICPGLIFIQLLAVIICSWCHLFEL